MPAYILPSTADVFLTCTTQTEPPVFTPCMAENVDCLRYSIRVRNAGADLTIPLPLSRLQPTDGPLIRLLLAFLHSRAFHRFRVSSTAHITIQTILGALWAFWSDIHGIKPTAYKEFCERLRALMPLTEPEAEDMTDRLQDFIAWVEVKVGVTELKFKTLFSNSTAVV
ncbi:hypothetical protein GSI_03097 [Ganoderma sinense ZZ0214-1]|uniref:Uncharacterized protein n=1 Tax=Ganoderma sinense ZZ0214-1 TaxID=1077348 RepID=A0A2G8SKN9_9APHY|nr:hypothetical protein GSI_03097 [Ganoderma sinense ZZ0214-1]